MNWWRRKPKMHRTRLGELLIEYGADPVKIDSAMADYYGRVPGRSGEHCLRVGACTPEQLNRALAKQAEQREDFGEASKYTASTIEDTHRSVLKHLDAARAQVKALIASHKVT
jgi:hypothetical protein